MDRKGSRAGPQASLIVGAALGLSAYACMQIAGFDELGFVNRSDEPQGGGGAGGGVNGTGKDCGPDAGCPPTGTECLLPVCDAGTCFDELAQTGTPCGDIGRDECDDAGVCMVERLRWSQRYGDAAGQTANSVALDTAGDVLVAGAFRGALTIGGHTLTSKDAYGPDVFVAKFTSDGNPVWSKRYGDLRHQTAWALATDGSDNVILVGDFEGTLEGFDPAPVAKVKIIESDAGDTIIPTSDVFVAKLNPAGSALWATGFGDVADGPGRNQRGRGVAVDDNYDIVVVGGFAGELDVTAPPLVSQPTLDATNAFVLKLDAAGQYLSSAHFDGTASHDATDVAVDSFGNVIVCGWFNNDLTIGATELHAHSGSAPDFFVAKLGADLSPLWARGFGGENADTARGVAVDETGQVVVVGEISGDVDFGIDVVRAGANSDAFVLRLDANGNPQSVHSYGDDEQRQLARAVAVTTQGQAVLTGMFTGTMDFGSGYALLGPFEPDLFLAKLGASGAPVYAYRFGSSREQQEGLDVAVSGGDVVVVGYLQGDVSLGGDVHPASGESDVFVAKYGP